VRHGIKQREPGAVDAGARRDCERGAARGPDPSLAQSAPRVTSGGASVCVLASPSLSPWSGVCVFRQPRAPAPPPRRRRARAPATPPDEHAHRESLRPMPKPTEKIGW